MLSVRNRTCKDNNINWLKLKTVGDNFLLKFKKRKIGAYDTRKTLPTRKVVLGVMLFNRHKLRTVVPCLRAIVDKVSPLRTV